MKERKEHIIKAIALKYNADKSASKQIVAKASGELAQKILMEAIDNNVEIYKDENLLNQLSNMKFLDSVPEELYSAAADIMEYIYSMDEKAKNIKGKD